MSTGSTECLFTRRSWSSDALPVPSGGSERGMVLLSAMLILVALGGLLLCVSTAVVLDARESLMVRQAEGARLAATSAFQVVCHALGRAGSWSDVLAGLETSPFMVTGLVRHRVDRTLTIDLADRSARLQEASDHSTQYGADQPRWRLYLSGHLSDIAAVSMGLVDAFVIGWVADDPVDGDGQAGVDANGVLWVHVEALGSGGARWSLRGSVERLPPPAGVRVRWVGSAR